MEVFNLTIPSNPQILSSLSIFSPKSSITTWRMKNNPLKFTIPNSKIPLCPPFSHYIPLPKSRKFHISAHFGRPTNRRNSLREKLTQQQQQQVRHNPIIYDPSSEFQNPVHKFDIDTTISLSNLDNDIEKQSNIKSDSVKESKLESLGDSVLWNQLESWADQYKADSEFWGVGSGPIFTVFQDSDGRIRRVAVNEDEILRRSRIEPSLYEQGEREDLREVNSKISHARFLARETEIGNYLIPKNSSVAKFVVSSEQSGFVNTIRGLTLRPGLFSRFSRVGITVLCGFFVLSALKMSFSRSQNREEYSNLEKEMLRRKLKARMEKEKLAEGSVEVVQDSKEPQLASIETPRIDKQDLVNSILKAKGSNDQLTLEESSSLQDIKSMDFDNRIQEIRAMARRAREIEKVKSSPGDSDGEDNQTVDKLSFEKEVIQLPGDRSVSSSTEIPNGHSSKIGGLSGTIKPTSFDDPKGDDTQHSGTSKVEVPNVSESSARDVKDREYGLDSPDTTEVRRSSEIPYTRSFEDKRKPDRAKSRVIRSVKEAREYLSRKREEREQNQEPHVRTVQEVDTSLSAQSGKGSDGNTSQGLDENDKMWELPILSGIPNFTRATNASVDNNFKREKSVPAKSIDPEALEILHLSDKGDNGLQPSTLEGKSDSTSAAITCGGSTLDTKGTVPTKNNDNEDVDDQIPINSLDLGSSSRTAEALPTANKENWMEKNFHEFEPIVTKIGVGFKDNYMVAKEKVNQELNSNTEMIQPNSDEEDGELDWMKDDKLREIVFQVRENELMGHDPFYLMDAEDKLAFFEGLEKKVEKENEKLQNLHQWVHSNIENLDYGADGISLYDPPEKIIPRWKGPPVNSSPEFLNDYAEQRNAYVAESLRNPYLMKRDGQDPLQESKESSSHEITDETSGVSTQNTKLQGGNLKTPKTVIEGSDGSIRAGKKSGKEYWQHTKKWSRGFLESYNAETDPEIKSVMKDMGKDLDRWITEKEIQEAADLMNKIPEKGRKFIDEKLNKVKREMELFGPQAVMSKYSEYTEEKEDDYLWWVDLPFVLCIELYTNQDGDQKIGFYSLEMAADLELDPKQYHVIAFEDTGDCKNFCYIIQAHMEMLGNGNAFVVAQPPKDAFREAKANGFSVTVIRKGELHLNVDQTLEEVEEQITEIGSKIYHDKIMKDRSVDISSLMKGVFGAKKTTKRKRSKRKLKKPTKY